MKKTSVINLCKTWWFPAGVLLVTGCVVASLFTPYPVQLVQAIVGTPRPVVKVVEKIVKVPVEVPVEVRVEVPVKEQKEPGVESQPWKPKTLITRPTIELPPFPPVIPEKLSTGTYEQVTALARGLHLRSSISLKPGSTASQDRNKKEAYMAHISLELLLPHAADGRELLQANPDLTRVLPQYEKLMEGARVSRWFASLYLHKQNNVRRNIASLAQPLDKHNFYDTDTILEITAPTSKRKVLWLQADMDVVSDGSDGDRLPTMPETILRSTHYQPTTSYRWKKRGTTVNPLLPGWESRLAKLLKEKPRNAGAIDEARRVIWDLKRYSYLLAQYDPFIVIPLVLKEGRDDAYRPKPGDYVAVVVGKKVIPAIVGDYGPRSKSGEASLRLGKLVNPKADINVRPVSALAASYIIFPHTAETEAGPINYKRLSDRCRELLDELGGLGPDAEFIEVEDLLAPKQETPVSPASPSLPAASPETPAASKPRGGE